MILLLGIYDSLNKNELVQVEGGNKVGDAFTGVVSWTKGGSRCVVWGSVGGGSLAYYQ